MKHWLLTAVCIVGLAGPAFAADTMAYLYGNTLEVKAKDGSVSTYQFAQDGTYAQNLADASKIKGSWAVKDNKLCLTQVEPAPAAGAMPACGPTHEARKPGDTWQYTADDGQVFTLTLIAGQ